MKVCYKNGVWVVVVSKDEILRCCSCKSEIQRTDTFYFCKSHNNLYCYNCRGKSWDKFNCYDANDDHTHFLIQSLEVNND